MSGFDERAKALFLQEKHADIDSASYMDMPAIKEGYVLNKVIGNVNLSEGRFRIKSEADAIINRFLAMLTRVLVTLPSTPSMLSSVLRRWLSPCRRKVLLPTV
jgi:hypothetical protein